VAVDKQRVAAEATEVSALEERSNSYKALYAHWERTQWSALVLDLSIDRASFAALDHEAQADMLWIFAHRFHAEFNVARLLAPFLPASSPKVRPLASRQQVVLLREPNPAVIATVPAYSRTSRAGQVADASAGLGEGLEPIRFDASPELRQRSPDQTEMDRTDNGLVGRRHLLEGTALEHDLLPALRSPELGPETELVVEANDLVDRLLRRDRPKRWRRADEVRAPRLSSLLGASAGVAL
jgi:hypothetical protein